MSNEQRLYTLKQIAFSLGMTPVGAKKALVKENVSMIKDNGKWYVDPAEFHRATRFSGIKVDKQSAQQPNQQLVTVESNVSQSLDKENNYLKQIIEIKDKQIEKLERDKADHKEEAKQWKDQAQKLLLLPPADNKQKATPMLLVAVSLGFLVVIALLITLFFIR